MQKRTEPFKAFATFVEKTTQYADEPGGEMNCGFRVKMTKADLLKYFSLSHLLVVFSHQHLI